MYRAFPRANPVGVDADHVRLGEVRAAQPEVGGGVHTAHVRGRLGLRQQRRRPLRPVPGGRRDLSSDRRHLLRALQPALPAADGSRRDRPQQPGRVHHIGQTVLPGSA
ncbi:hypothetical protein [Streptomyces griseoluteus]|uniref:hypothetical protein n=1 Tax=Streptomyces griseoluteus TaxID=29306 RepID=UPI003701328A